MIGSVITGSANVVIGGQPAAHKTAMAAHSGPVLNGATKVQVNSFAAARITDTFTCPMSDGPKPHVGGKILPPGFPTVVVEGLPAARMGDVTLCSGPPQPGMEGGFGGAHTAPAVTQTVDCRGQPLANQEEPNSCVVASMRMILEQKGKYSSGDESGLREAAKAPPPGGVEYSKEEGSNPYFIAEFLKNGGVDCEEKHYMGGEQVEKLENEIMEARANEERAKDRMEEAKRERDKYKDDLDTWKKKQAEFEKTVKAHEAAQKAVSDKKSEKTKAINDIQGKANDPAQFEAGQKQLLDDIEGSTKAKDGKTFLVGIDNANPPSKPPKANHRLIVDGVVEEPPGSGKKFVLLRDPYPNIASGSTPGCAKVPMADFKARVDPRSPVVVVK